MTNPRFINYKSSVYAKVELEGVHCWANCPHEEVSYLRDPHRHTFIFKAYSRVRHNDRDQEFIMMQHQIRDYILGKYYDEVKKCCVFGSMSCEMLGEDIMNHFDNIYKMDISEDGENGAIITKNDITS